MWDGHGYILAPVVVLRFGRRGGEAADAGLRRRAHGRHAVGVVVGARGHLVGGAVGNKALCDLELGVLQVLLQLGVLVGSRQFLVGGRGALRRHHAVAALVCGGRAEEGEDDEEEDKNISFLYFKDKPVSWERLAL